MYTDTNVQIDAALEANRYSSTMSDDLNRLGRDVDDLLAVWTGGAADSYGQSWMELTAALQTIIDDLDRIGSLVGESARDYAQAEADNATAVSSTSIPPSSEMLRL